MIKVKRQKQKRLSLVSTFQARRFFTFIYCLFTFDLLKFDRRHLPFYAGAVVEKMLAAAIALNHLPQAGRIVPELNQPDIRERFVYSYRLIYRIETARIVVAAVIHGKRLLDDATTHRLADE